MARFVMECPSCGRYTEARTGFFAKKKIDCSCGHTINVRTERMVTRTCPHCGNLFVYDQADGTRARCPVCKEKVVTTLDSTKIAEFSCEQCGVRLSVNRAASSHVCPVCDHVNDVTERLKTEWIKKDGLASVIKYEGDADTLVWKHPIEDFNMGSQLIVHESQEAIFFRDGQALDLFGAGRYTLETQQLPVLEKLYKLPTDTEGTFHSEVYFFNLVHQMAVKWGTPEKVTLQDPQTGALISLGARGTLNFKIANARKLLLKLVGTGGKLTRQQLMEDGEGHIHNHFRSLIQLAVSTNLANIITDEKMDILLLDQQKMRLSAAMLSAIQSSFAEYGLVVTEFLILGIALPQKGDVGYEALQKIMKIREKNLDQSVIASETELKLAELEAENQLKIRIEKNVAEVEKAHRDVIIQRGENAVLDAQYETQAERVRMQLEMDRKIQIAQIEAEEMRLKGYNQKDVMQTEVQKEYAGALGQMGANGGGGVLGDVAGLGVVLGTMGSVAGAAREAVTPMMQTGVSTPAPAASAAIGWDCACGARSIQSKFCPNCGAKKPEPKAADTWDCPNCGKQGITDKFCGECGCKKPEAPAAWDCSQCGNKGITAKFCGECGCKKPEEPAAWDCPQCGNKAITAKFCPECGLKRG